MGDKTINPTRAIREVEDLIGVTKFNKKKQTQQKERNQMFKIKPTTKSAIISVLVTLAILGVFTLGAFVGTKIQQAIDSHTKSVASELVTQLKIDQ